MASTRNICSTLCSCGALVALIATVRVARASEYGVGTYRPGEVDLFAGMLAPPCGVLIKDYFMFQDADLTARPNNAPVKVHTHTITYTEATLIAYTTPWRLLGANWAIGTIAQTRIANQTLKVATAGGPTSTGHSTVRGFGDLIVSPLMLNWNFSKFHLVGALMFYAPTGSYDRPRIIDIGLNRPSLSASSTTSNLRRRIARPETSSG